MTTTSDKAVRARQRLARERRRIQKAEHDLRREQRRLDTRRKVLVGSVVLDVLLPKSENLRSLVGDVLGQAITNNNRKTVPVRREELNLFRADFGEEWYQSWSAAFPDDES